MKRVSLLLFSFLCIVVFSSCGNNSKGGYVGVNAEIVELTSEINGMVVRGLDENSILGDVCYVNCSIDDISFIYVNNETEELIPLSINDFVVGDQITLDIESVTNSYTEPTRVQLLTQRYN